MNSDVKHIPCRDWRRTGLWVVGLLLAGLQLAIAKPASAQDPSIRHGETVPRDVRELYERGLQHLAATQLEAGDWPGYEQGPGTTGMAVMVFLACGEDPNFGIYSTNIRKGLRSIISSQSGSTGFLGSSMYHHGFAMLALAEAYGTVDDRQLWAGIQGSEKRSVGEALELAVRCAVASQKRNSAGGWRYSPDGNDADTSVSGAVLVGLLAARNAGIEVPDAVIDRAITYFKQMTSNSGAVAYSGIGGGFDHSPARISIGTLVYAIARRKDLPQYKATLEYLKQNLEQVGNGDYCNYYEAQALFQGDVEAWEKWNKLLVREMKAKQKADGSIGGDMNGSVGTSLPLLALALNYKFLPIYER